MIKLTRAHWDGPRRAVEEGPLWVRPLAITAMFRSGPFTDLHTAGRVFCVSETPEEIMAMPEMALLCPPRLELLGREAAQSSDTV